MRLSSFKIRVRVSRLARATNERDESLCRLGHNRRAVSRSVTCEQVGPLDEQPEDVTLRARGGVSPNRHEEFGLESIGIWSGEHTDLGRTSMSSFRR